MTLTAVQLNSKTAQDFLWLMANRYCELKHEALQDVKMLSDITDFSFYGDSVVMDAPVMLKGMLDTAKEFAAARNMTFKATNACGDVWVLQMQANDCELDLKEAFKENIAIGGSVFDKSAWKANQIYFKHL